MKPSHSITSLVPDSKSIAALSLTLILAACGGGGGSDTAPVATTVPPVVTTVPPVVVVPVPLAIGSPAMISPVNAATGVEYNASVSFTANRDLKSAEIRLFCNVGNLFVAGTTTVSGKVATFNPTVKYPANSTCVADVVTAKTIDMAGIAFASNARITTFTTKPDVVIP